MTSEMLHNNGSDVPRIFSPRAWKGMHVLSGPGLHPGIKVPEASRSPAPVNGGQHKKDAKENEKEKELLACCFSFCPDVCLSFPFGFCLNFCINFW